MFVILSTDYRSSGCLCWQGEKPLISSGPSHLKVCSVVVSGNGDGKAIDDTVGISPEDVFTVLLSIPLAPLSHKPTS